MNNVQLIGRLGQDPEARFFESGKVVANLSLAVYAGKDRVPNWFSLQMWGKNAETAHNYLKKGSQIGIVGRLDINHWTDKQSGQDRSKPVIVVESFTFCDSRPKQDDSDNQNNEF